jgi:hypothetical protein
LPDRSNQGDKRRLLLDAAVRVFRLPDSDDDLARAERTVAEIVTGGLTPDHAGAPA